MSAGGPVAWVTRGISRGAGWFAERPLPRPLRRLLFGWFARRYRVRVAEADRPLEAYPTFEAFFTRALRPGARRVDPTSGRWVSPVDGCWLSHVPVETGTVLLVKGNRHRLDVLLGDERSAQRFTGGAAAVFYLRPGDYHRIHAPTELWIERVRAIGGVLWPVNRWGQRIPELFCRNERWVLLGRTRQGRFAMVWVGALMVGSIRFDHPGLPPVPARGGEIVLTEPVHVEKGALLGAFRFGSTVVLVSEGRPEPLGEPPCEVRMGEAVWAWAEASTQRR